MTDAQVDVTDAALKLVIHEYTRESGLQKTWSARSVVCCGERR